MDNSMPCPCESGASYRVCCEQFHCGHDAPTALQLMRSRYSAYVLAKEDYLLQTWHPSTRPSCLNITQHRNTWLGLKIISTHAGQENDNSGLVEFIARYKTAGRATRLHETSEFVKQHGKWFYLKAKETND